MKECAGERLFEAIGQIPDQMVLEAAQEQNGFSAADQPGQADDALDLQGTDAVQDKEIRCQQEVRQDQNASRDQKKHRSALVKLDGYLKYLPVAACLCMVLAGAGYVVNHFVDTGWNTGTQMSGSLADTSGEEGQIKEEEVVMMDQAADQAADSDGGTSDAGMLQPEQENQKTGYVPMLPARYDAYDGPVFPLTATGDTQKLKVSRVLKAAVHTQEQGDEAQPLLQVTDTYQMKNMSKQDKTLQLVYPFVTTLNRAFAMEGNILQVKGQEQAAVTYSIGESIQAYRGADASGAVSIEDYQQIFTQESDYQERALAKEADWDRSVYVYTFSDIQVQEGAAAANTSGVIGVTVHGAQSDVLTYGFDHSFRNEDGSRNDCFFIPQEDKQLLLIVTGEIEGEPQLGYYANLDCKEKMTGVTCSMSQEEMSYADALRLCSKDAVRQLRNHYEQGLYDAELPEYMNEDAAFRVLTMMSEEEDFYRVLMQRYENTELTEVFERMLGETRVVYAMATVTIPAKETIQAVVQTQKRQNAGNYMLLTDDSETDHMDENQTDTNDAGGMAEGETYVYDFLSAAQSRLSVKKTDFRVVLSEEWKIADEDCGLEQKRDYLWKTEILEGDACIVIAGASDEK